MFEGWTSDLLASYLGQVLDIQQEQLKINLWTGTRCHYTSLDRYLMRWRVSCLAHQCDKRFLNVQHGRLA